MEHPHIWNLIPPAALGYVLTLLLVPQVLIRKKDPTSALAWCVAIVFLPIIGSLLFLVFGNPHIAEPLSRKRRHHQVFTERRAGGSFSATVQAVHRVDDQDRTSLEGVQRLSNRLGLYPITEDNAAQFHISGIAAYDAMKQIIRQARHHIHMEYYIFQPDATGREFRDLLAEKARQGIEVRLLYDAIGSWRTSVFHPRFFKPLIEAGGRTALFMPVSLLRRMVQINLRNHRKILVVDGRVASMGGLNIGDEYLGKVARYGFWRDTDVRIEGPALAGLQRVFIEDWDFATGEDLDQPVYFPDVPAAGSDALQIIWSGPDQDWNTVRELYFAAITRARQRIWIASPYFVPDPAIIDGLRTAALMGVDVRLLTQGRPDQWLPLLAARYYWDDLIRVGVKIYRYHKGMYHAKILIADDWASIGSANLDNRSLRLNFEVSCLVYTPRLADELAARYLADLEDATPLDPRLFLHRPLRARIVENAARLLSPIL